MVLADAGYASEVPVKQLLSQGVEVLVSVASESVRQPRKFDFRPLALTQEKPHKKNRKKWVVEMKEAMEKDRAKELYKKRKITVEPVFGIIKQVLGFRQFLLRGLKKVNLEWQLVSCAYNLKRLAVLVR